MIYEYVIDKNTPNFFDARVVARYKEITENIGIKADQRFMIAEHNSEFRIYRMLAVKHLSGRTVSEDERLHKETISNEISAYAWKDFCELFRTCNFLERTVVREHWALGRGLEYIFEIIEDDRDLYLKVLGEYFNANAPFSLNGYRQIKYMLKHIGYEATNSFVNNYTFDKKDAWVSLIWELLPEENVDDKVVNDCKEFVLNNLKKDNPVLPAAQVVIRYGECDSELKGEVIKAIEANPELSSSFLGYAYDDNHIEEILNFFRNDMEVLVLTYISALAVNDLVDCGGKLFEKIFEQQPTIWNEYVNWVKDRDITYSAGNEHKIFELIWKSDNWRKCVEDAFKVLIDDGVFYTEDIVETLFTKQTDAPILERKKTWLIEKLRENSMEIEKCKNLIYAVVNFFPDWKLVYILEFLKANKKLEDFKKIYLFPASSSWSKTEVPCVLEKIDFLRLLKENLKGIDYIDHKKHIEDMCRSLEKYKEKVELREYLDNIDYA